MEQPTPPPFVEENIEVNYTEDSRVSKGKFSFVSGIIVCALTIIVYIGILISFGARSEEMLYVFAVISFLLLAAAVVGLIFGIKGVRSQYKVKSIIGLAFGGQNIISSFFLIILALAFASQSSYSSLYYY